MPILVAPIATDAIPTIPQVRVTAIKRIVKTTILLLAIAAAAPVYAKGSSGGHHGGHHSSMSSYGTGAKSSHEHVSGYTKRDGTYVAPHEKSTPDHTKNNNWDTKGNYNPYTGKAGTKRGDD